MPRDRSTAAASAGRRPAAGAPCTRSRSPGQPPAASERRGAWQDWRCRASMWVVVMVLASCQNLAGETASTGTVAREPAGYPSLHTVPPRPQLSYTGGAAARDRRRAGRRPRERPLHQRGHPLSERVEQHAAAGADDRGGGPARGSSRIRSPHRRPRRASGRSSTGPPSSSTRTTISARSWRTCATIRSRRRRAGSPRRAPRRRRRSHPGRRQGGCP